MSAAIIDISAADLALNGDSQGTSLALPPSKTVDYYVIKGTATLTSSLTISVDTKNAVQGDRIVFEYHANVTLNSQTLTIAGKSIPDRLDSSPMLISAVFDGTNTLVTLLPTLEASERTVSNTNIVTNSITAAELATGAVAADEIASDAVITAKILNANVTADKLASDAVTTAKILNSNVTVEKLETEALESSFVIPIHFDYANKDTFHLSMPTKCTIVRLRSVVSGTAIGGTHAATMTINNATSGAALAAGVTLHAASAGEGTVATISLSNTSIAQGDVLTFTPDGSQTSGKVFLTMTLRRVAD